MKSKLKKLLPVIVVAVAVAGALSTHAMNQKAGQATLVNGYIQLDPEGMSCQQSSTQCTTVNTGVQCTVGYSSSGAQLFRIDSDNSCIQPLYKPESN